MNTRHSAERREGKEGEGRLVKVKGKAMEAAPALRSAALWAIARGKVPMDGHVHAREEGRLLVAAASKQRLRVQDGSRYPFVQSTKRCALIGCGGRSKREEERRREDEATRGRGRARK